MSGVSATTIIGHTKGKKPAKDHFYATPDEVTEALFDVWRPAGDCVWEPACGDGCMADVIKRHGYSVIATDLVDRGYSPAEHGVDFLMEHRKAADVIITNPPFNLAAGFIDTAFHLGVRQLALLLKCTYWHAKTRQRLYQQSTPSLVMPLTWRPDFSGEGSPTLDLMWCVWDGNFPGMAHYRPLNRKGKNHG